MNLEEFRLNAEAKHKEHKAILAKLKKRTPKNLDQLMLSLHQEVFSEIDCLECANCCKTTGPLFTQKDIDRISKRLRLKPSVFIDKYLRIDEDNDYVLQSLPCVFLDGNNACIIYEDRPKACREFPHTDRKKFQQINHLTIKNCKICPAAHKVVENLGQVLK